MPDSNGNLFPETQDGAILVVSCDRYRDVWPVFFHYFFKNWPDCPYPLYLGSNTCTYEHPNVYPILVGEDLDYSSNLMNMLRKIPEKWVILWIEDRILTSPVSTAEINELLKIAKYEDIGYIKLISGHPLPNGHKLLKKIGEIPRSSRYRVCVTVGLWRKDLLNHILVPGESPWEIEINGSKRASSMDEKFYSVSIDYRKSPPIIDKHLIIKGKVFRDMYEFLKNEGFTDFLTMRKKQSIYSYLYVKIHRIMKNTYSMSRWFIYKLYNSSIQTLGIFRRGFFHSR